MPQADLEEGDVVVGALGISSDGLHFETPDGMPVHCMVLIATPPSQRSHRLEVMAAFARAMEHFLAKHLGGRAEVPDIRKAEAMETGRLAP